MNQVLKGALAAAALPLAAFPLALGGGAASASAAGLIPEGPATVLTHGPAPWDMPQFLQGAGCEPPKNCQEVLYWWIVSTPTYEIGVNENLLNLDYAINQTTGPKIVYAFSGGARIATAWLTERADESDVAANDLSFLLVGNGTRKYGGASTWSLGDGITAPPTRYAVIDVAREYDPVADFPTNPFNLLAMANALSAFNIVHMNYRDVDLDDPDNYVWTEDNTTYVFVPTKNLPLLQPLRNLGLGALADQWEEPLRAIIDTAYERTYLPAQPQGEQSADVLQSASHQTSRSTVTSLSPNPEDVEDTSEGSQDVENVENVEGIEDVVATDESPDHEGATSEVGETDADTDVTELDDVADQAGDETGDDSAQTDKPTGPKHRAPLNGTKKTTPVDPAERTDSGDAENGGDAKASSDDQSSPSSASDS